MCNKCRTQAEIDANLLKFKMEYQAKSDIEQLAKHTAEDEKFKKETTQACKGCAFVLVAACLLLTFVAGKHYLGV